ncbi:MAG: selenide, water dikinase SelD [Bacteroidetes bacterium]|nr:selenide, water dikinase SelD [Bacteroidota bacterium]
MTSDIKLTQYSHGAGCGCKISPAVLDKILQTREVKPDFKNLLVGNHSRDDAAVLDMGNGIALISTTDFFMPIVDNPFEFGRIAAANAISDVYAMGGTPSLAIAILGWPIDKLAPEVAGQVVDGGRFACQEAGIALAGGHSIDCPEPIFGLAVNGFVPVKNLKQNNTAKAGNLLYLTKPLGVGILTTAEKKGILREPEVGLAARQMMELNKIGAELGKMEKVTALTDVTGFGLLGHLVEMAAGSGLSAEVDMKSIPLIIDDLVYYIQLKSIPGGTNRNWASYGSKIGPVTDEQKAILADPQTSGGLMIAIDPSGKDELETLLKENGLVKFARPIGRLMPENHDQPRIQIRS